MFIILCSVWGSGVVLVPVRGTEGEGGLWLVSANSYDCDVGAGGHDELAWSRWERSLFVDVAWIYRDFCKGTAARGLACRARADGTALREVVLCRG